VADIPTRSITQLPIASSINGNDKFVISQGGVTKTAIANQIRQITSSLSVENDLFVGKDAYVSGTTQTGVLRVVSTASVGQDLYVNRDAYVSGTTQTGVLRVVSTASVGTDFNVSGKTATGSLVVTGQVSAASANFSSNVKIDGVVSITGDMYIDRVANVSIVTFNAVSEGSAAPTSPGQLRFTQTTPSVIGQNGMEFLSSTFGSGYGFNIKCIDDGMGVATKLGFAKRRNNVAWSLAGYYDDLGNFVWSSGTALATNATNGFIYIPSCSGVPSGVPATKSGTVPIVMDIVNSKLYAYRAGAWAGVSLS